MTVIPMPRKRPDEGSLLTATDLARRWRMHRDSIYRIPAELLPYMKLGRNTRRYRPEDVAAFEEQQRVTGCGA